MDESHLAYLLNRDLCQVIEGLPGFIASSEAGNFRDGHRFDFVVRVEGRTSATLLVDCKAASQLYPRDVREWLWQVRQQLDVYPGHQDRPATTVLAAASLSPGVREMLKAENVGYYDRSGSLFLPLPGAYVLIDRPVSKRPTPERSLFTDRRATVVHALLRRPQAPISVNSLAEELHLSAATVSETLSLLDRMDWTRAEGRGPAKWRLLTEPGALLDAWSRHLVETQPLKSERYFVPGRDATKIAERFGTACEEWKINYAFTGEIAGQALAPLLSSIQVARCRVVATAFMDSPLEAAGAKQVSEGANLECIRSSPGELSFTQKTRELVLASPVQVYLDLLRLPGRAKELGAHLRREKLGF